MNSFEAQKQMNKLGEARLPFFFVIDFLAKENIIWQIDQIPDDVAIEFPSFKKVACWENIPQNFCFDYKKVDFDDYRNSFERLQNYINRGDTYLCNLTVSVEITTNLSLSQIFAMSSAKYKIKYKDVFVCFSPEIFVQIRDGKIYSFPMKGTIDASVENAEKIILSNYKETAEHYTIVDLIRNDLSIVAQNVEVERFRYIDKIITNNKTLLQVSSRISGILQPNYNEILGNIMYSLLPAGSISGAPKKKTVEIIQEIETHNRGFYTGIAGFFDGHNLDSCVLIRFIEKQNDKMIYKAGGGITSMSQLIDEYNEIHNKVYIPLASN